MRTFRKCITEFVLDPVNQPAHFQTHLWRYPVRIDIAIEYLGISREEYATLFHGVWPRSCAHRRDEPREPQNELQCWQLYGFASEHVVGVFWTDIAVRLPEFLKRTCLTYCEFIELWKCGPVKFRNGHDRKGIFPDCEPCCLEDLWLEFGEDTSAGLCGNCGIHTAVAKTETCLRGRLHLLSARRHLPGVALSQPRLHPPVGGIPDASRPVPAKANRRGNSSPGATGADRTYLLSLWVGPAAAHWDWAIQHLIEGIAFHAEMPARMQEARTGVPQTAGLQLRFAFPPCRIRPGCAARHLACRAYAHSAFCRSAGQNLRFKLQHRRDPVPLHRRSPLGRRRSVCVAG